MAPCKVYFQYTSKNEVKADFFLSRRVEKPKEDKCDVKKIDARPTLIIIPSRTSDGMFKNDYIYLTIQSKGSMELLATA